MKSNIKNNEINMLSKAGEGLTGIGMMFQTTKENIDKEVIRKMGFAIEFIGSQIDKIAEAQK